MPPLETAHVPTPWHQGHVATSHKNSSSTVSEKSQPPPVRCKEKKSVHFSAKLLIRGVSRRQDFSEDEARKMWMDHFDLSNNRRDIYNTIYLMRSGLSEKLSEEDYFCARGLEKFVDRKSERRCVRQESIGIALAMQRILRRSGSSNPEMIAKAYHKYTVSSQYIAHQKGIRDQVAVERGVDTLFEGQRSCMSQVPIECRPDSFE